jgi:soluble lytic murein transglycosylase-like protein
MSVRSLVLFAISAAVAFAQSSSPDAIRAAMEASLAQQRASIAKQAQNAVRTDAPSAQQESFFWAPWPKPVKAQQAASDCDPLSRAEVDRLAEDASKNEHLSVDLIRTVMEKESGFRPCAVSSQGAQGLMQLMPATAQDLNVTDPFDPKQNVSAGARYLKQLLDKYSSDVERALGAYNAGPGRVDRSGGVPQIRETQNYVLDIVGRLLTL